MTTEHVRFVRRNRVDERYAVAIGALAGAAAAVAPAAPTGRAWVDAILVAASVGFVTWAGATAPWFVVALAGGVAATIALEPLVAVVGFFGFLIGLHVGLYRSDDAELRAVGVGLAANALAWSRLEGFHGLSAIVGEPRRPRPPHRS